MDITPALTTFGLIALAEMGDKTQLIAITLSARCSRFYVLAGLTCAFLVLTGLAVGVGEIALTFIGPHIIGIAAGLIFIAFGIMTLKADIDDMGPIKNQSRHGVFFTAFSLIALAEIGDKTELAVIALAARYHAPYMVFFSAVAALVLVSALGVVLGSRLPAIVPMDKIKIGSGALFIFFGIMFLMGA